MLQEKMNALRETLRSMESVVVAFSGGVDSTFLLRVALDELGPDNVLAVTADSETYPSEELSEAKKLAEAMGAPHQVIQTSELEIPGYSENTSNRCYFCKKSLFEHLVPILSVTRHKNVVYGLIADDLSDHRPGMRAAKEHGVRGPLAEAGLFKEEIRELSQQMGLPTWDKPSFACLSSRIAYGEIITQGKLTKIGKSEAYLKSLGVRQVRVRTHGEMARIEVDPLQMQLIMNHMDDIASTLKSFGYTYVTLDLSGYRSGSMNQALTEASGG